MSDIATKLSYLNETKSKFAEALAEKGMEITEDTTFRQMAEMIKNVEISEGENTQGASLAICSFTNMPFTALDLSPKLVNYKVIEEA